MIGIDVAVIARFEKHRDNPRFHDRILTPRERRQFLRRPSAENLAAFFAVKEAAAKALGTGIGRIAWKDIELFHSPLGQPRAIITDHKKGVYHKVAISITHDGGLVIASAMLRGYTSFLTEDTASDLRGLIKIRQRDMHKGTAGKACLIGGSAGMAGSISLAAKAVLRAGAGYAYVAVRPEIFSQVQQKLTEPIIRPLIVEKDEGLLAWTDEMDGCGIGPGLGTDTIGKGLVQALICREGCPLVIDADALRILAEWPELLLKKGRPLILTPHSGELLRLLEKEKTKSVSAFVQNYDIILVEKGPDTKIHTKTKTYTNPTGNAGLATAGTGDVLTGVITGLLARGYAPVEAARLGVWLHGCAGDLAKTQRGEEGMIASDVLEKIPYAWKKLKEDDDGLWEYLGGD